MLTNLNIQRLKLYHKKARLLIEPLVKWMSTVMESSCGNIYLNRELFAEREPFQNQILQTVTKAVLEKNLRPAFNFDIDPKLQNLIVKCWDSQPESRPSFQKIIETLEVLSF